MAKYLSGFLAIVFILIFSGSAYSEPYVSGFGGIAFLSDSDVETSDFPTVEVEFDSGYNFAGALGYDWGGVRGELEIGYQENDFDSAHCCGINADASGDVTAVTYMAALYWDFDTSSNFTPYLGLGIGVAVIDVNSPSASSGPVTFFFAEADDTVLAYRLATGFSYAMTTSFDLTLGYNFLGTGDPDFEGSEAEVSSHNFNAGIRVRF